MERLNINKNKGITLIALVITVIVLLILAGVSIAMLTGENGILNQAKKAKEETERSGEKENDILERYEQYIVGRTNGGTLITVTGKENTNTIVYDSLGNKVVVPSGFKIVNPGDNVEDGIIIEDTKYRNTKGSQFVWIPVGKIKTKEGEKEIVLDRYTFDEDGNPTSQGNNKIEHKVQGVETTYYYQEIVNTSYSNIGAKNINDFLSITKEQGGFYVGRFEARTIEKRKNKEDELKQMTLKQDDFVYNYVTQVQSATLSQTMYEENENFSSDLINSYAWDTLIIFIQQCSDSKKYSQQCSLNNELAEKGTNNKEIQDKICNVFDLSSNCYEFTTESHMPYSPGVSRGGYYTVGNNGKDSTSTRHSHAQSASYADISFRPILYLK